jgi:hypothetical protein
MSTKLYFFKFQQRSVRSLKDFQRGRNGSVPAQLFNHNNNINNGYNNNGDGKKVGGGILRRNSSRLQVSMLLSFFVVADGWAK